MAQQWKEMTMGTCYYPEHWPREMWQSDLERMQKAGITVVRVAEFAWNFFEPEEDVFTFDFFQDFLDLCKKTGMKVIFGTPTATPPAWLTEKYPEVLNCNKDGVPYRHGGRGHHNYNSPVYRRFTARIVEKLAQQYASHPAVIGWQIHNELNCESCVYYSEADTLAFREYLRERYGTLERLNQALGTTFWNQTYTRWEQIYVPRPTLTGAINPHFHLEYIRFISHSTRSYCKLQADILRRYIKPGDFITTNGTFANLDNHSMTRESLDFFTHDSYPNFAFGLDNPTPEGELRDQWTSLKLTDVRSICPHFGIMEQQSGANGWTTRLEAPAPRPGQLTLWAMQSVAHGADFISFFRWRTCTFGTEIYWHGILDYDSRDNRKLKEVTEFGKMLKALDALCGSDFKASFALLKDYDNEWDTSIDHWHSRVQQASHDGIFEASAHGHMPYNTVFMGQPNAEEELMKHPVALYPHPTLIDEERAAILRRYVENGGTLIIGCRSGYKDMNGKCVMVPQPGLLQPLTGSDIHDFTLTSFAEPENYAMLDGNRLEAPIFNDILTPIGEGNAIAAYEESYYRGEAALVVNRLGRGRVLHWGSTFTKNNTLPLLKYAGAENIFASLAEAPEHVEMVLREKDGKRWLFLLNYLSAPQEITLKKEMRSLFTGEVLQGRQLLSPFGVMVTEA